MNPLLIVFVSLLFLTLNSSQATADALPEGAKLESSPVGATINFKDKSIYEEGPTGVKANGPEAVSWLLERLRNKNPIFTVFNSSDVISIEKYAVGFKIGFIDGSTIDKGPTRVATSGGVADHYAKLLNDFGH